VLKAMMPIALVAAVAVLAVFFISAGISALLG
jgi:hypothetical protein